MINYRVAKLYCAEDISKIENFDKAEADQTETWCLHHKQGVYMSKDELFEYGWYYKCPADCLIFVTKAQHRQIHGTNLSSESRKKISEKRKGMKFSEEHCKHLSESMKGRTAWNKGRKFSEEARRKMSEAAKRRYSKNCD